MDDAKVPHNEADRLKSVKTSQLWDTPAEERFDRLTRLACRLLGTPVAMLTMIGQERQWFKSAQGHLIAETPKVQSFCQYTILDGKTLVVEDASTDERYFDLSVVYDLGVRFYAGVPVRNEEGYILGTLCVLDFSKRRTELEDKLALEDLARCAESELRLVGLLEAERQLLSEMDELRRRASQDPVSRCWNETSGMAILEKMKAQNPISPHSGVAVLHIGLDRLGEFHKLLGREGADMYVRQVADRLRGVLPQKACLVRGKGASFLVLFPTLIAQAAEAVCQDILAQAGERAVQVGEGSLPVDLTGGVAFSAGVAEPVDALLSRAESAKQAAQRSGPGSVRRAV